MACFRVFAMYVRTELVHMYIAKRPSFLLYRILAVPKMGTWSEPVGLGQNDHLITGIGLKQMNFRKGYTIKRMWTFWSCWQIAESYRQICFKFAVYWKMARKKTPGGVIPYTLSFVLSWLRSPKGGSDLSLPLIRAVTGVLNCGPISGRQKYLRTRFVSF